MPASWKKVVVSGSTPNFANIQVDGLTSGQVVIGGGSAGNLTSTAVNGTGNIVATTGATGLAHSGSFSGSFSGPLTGTSSYATQALTASYVTSSNVFGPNGSNSILTASFAITASYVLGGSATPGTLTGSTGITAFSFNGATNAAVAISGAANLGTNTITKWTGTAFANSSLYDDATNVTGSVSIKLTGASSALTGSFTGSFIGSLTGTASYASQALSASNALTASYLYPGTYAVTASWAVTASNALTASQLLNALTLGNGLTGTSFNGSSAVTAAVGAGALISVGTGLTAVATSSLTTNQIPKFSNNTLSGSNISDTGTQVQISATATSGLSVGAGGVNVTGNSTFNNNVTITGDLSVAGTASFTNTDNLNIKDKFILINSGSTTLADSGWVTQYNAAGSGSAFFLEAGSTGPYGRFAVAYDTIGTSTSIAADEYVVTAKLSAASAPSNTVSSSWGSTNSGGNMWIKQDTGDIYIWA
jgi:hypothetical protein